MAARYYYLLARSSKNSPWRIEFCADDLQDVKDKYKNYRGRDHKVEDLRIVGVPDNHLATIKTAISELNE